MSSRVSGFVLHCTWSPNIALTRVTCGYATTRTGSTRCSATHIASTEAAVASTMGDGRWAMGDGPSRLAMRGSSSRLSTYREPLATQSNAFTRPRPADSAVTGGIGRQRMRTRRGRSILLGVGGSVPDLEESAHTMPTGTRCEHACRQGRVQTDTAAPRRGRVLVGGSRSIRPGLQLGFMQVNAMIAYCPSP